MAPLRAGEGELGAWRMNVPGEVRSLREAVDVARKHGVDLPDWIRVTEGPANQANYAEYKLVSSTKPDDWVTWERCGDKGIVTVRLHPDVLQSDEAIVAVLSHESYELTTLREIVEQANGMRAREVNGLIHEGSSTNVHGQAWDVSDLRIMLMRGDSAAESRLARLLAKFRMQNFSE